MKWIICIVMALSLASFSACKQSDSKSETTPATEATDTPATQTGAEIPDEKLPIETDFEEAAEKEISADNYQAELDKLEQEITGGQ